MMYAFFDDPDNILVYWDVCVYEASQEVAIASFFFSLKESEHRSGRFLLFLAVGWGCACGAGCRADTGPGFIFFHLSLQIKMKIKTQ